MIFSYRNGTKPIDSMAKKRLGQLFSLKPFSGKRRALAYACRKWIQHWIEVSLPKIHCFGIAYSLAVPIA